jgi:hypothetical protein
VPEDKGIPKSIWIKFNAPELRRTYYFPDGKAEFKNVIGLVVSPNGTHYLQTKEGGKYIVRCGWMYIDLDVEEWTYPGPFVFAESSGAKLT